MNNHHADSTQTTVKADKQDKRWPVEQQSQPSGFRPATRAARVTILAALLGSAADLAVVVLGTLLGLGAKLLLDSDFVFWEMAPIAVALVTVPVGFFVGVLGAVSGNSWRGFWIGLIAHGLVFGWLFAASSDAPFATNLWWLTFAVVAGAAAGAAGGWLGSKTWSQALNRGTT